MHLDCTHCRENNDANVRAAMGCGWMHIEYDEEDGKLLPPPSVWKHPQDTTYPMVCPGYTTALPDVIDIATTYPHHDKGNLSVYFPDGTCRALMDGFAEMDRSIATFINRPVKK